MTRYTKKQLDEIQWPHLLVVNDKYSRGYYWIENAAAVGRASLQILQARVTIGYISDPGPRGKIWGFKAVLPRSQAEILPEPYRTQAIKDIVYNDRLIAEWQREATTFCEAVLALRDRDGAAAWQILGSRQGHQYEDFELISVEIP